MIRTGSPGRNNFFLFLREIFLPAGLCWGSLLWCEMRGVFCREKEFRGGQTLFVFLFFSQYIFYLADKERDVFCCSSPDKVKVDTEGKY